MINAPINKQNTDIGTGSSAVKSRLRLQMDMTRATLVIGAGGSGQKILTYLKAILNDRFDDLWRNKIRLLALDTAEEAFTVNGADDIVSLEDGVEFISMGNVPVASIMRNLDAQEAIRERLGQVMVMLPPVVLRSGAKQLRPFGLLSLLWHFSTVSKAIRRALWRLAGRDQMDATTFSQQQGINVIICGSLVGGTGSGTVLDLGHMVRAEFTELGAQADFCHITGVFVLPQAFYGITGPNILPNTGAALEELNHLMIKGGFQTRYPDNRIIDSKETPFDLCYVIDGVDARGQTWTNIHDVAEMVAAGLYLQMGSQIGRQGENAFDNLREKLTQQTADGYGRFLASFGKGDLEFDAPAVADVCTHWLLLELLTQAWLPPADADDKQIDQMAQAVEPAALTDRLNRDPETGSAMRVELVMPGWLRRKGADEVAAEAAHYISEYGQARIAEAHLAAIDQQGEVLVNRQKQRWDAWLTDCLLAPNRSLATVLMTLRHLQAAVSAALKTAHKETGVQEKRLSQLTAATAQMETGLVKAASSFVIGRNGRTRSALTRYFRSAQEQFAAQVDLQLWRTQQTIHDELNAWLGTKIDAVSSLRQRLATLAQQLEMETGRRLEKVAARGVARLSLAEPDYVRALYRQHKPGWADVKEQIGNPKRLFLVSSQELAALLLAALRPNFDAIAAMTVEQALQARADEMSPQARRQQLFQLATPSWNIDRARLPDGGAGLVRLEVLGVTDAAHTLFADEPMLVSTHDPHRLTALMVVAGAPATALQQYDKYRREMELVRNKRPLHILPAFLTGNEQGQLMFALGSIFGLIYNQGTFFYYKPADALASPLRLANGLNNAIRAFIEAEGLAAEVSERIDAHIARLGLRDAITILTDYYSSVPDGNTALDEQLRTLKKLVRDYTDSLRRIDDFSAGTLSGASG